MEKTIGRTIGFGKIALYGTRRINEVEVELELKDTQEGPVFTASASVWNSRRTDIVMGGQCLDDIKLDDPLFGEIVGLWKRHHLNGMHAGTERQEQALRDHERAAGGKPAGDYNERLMVLRAHGLEYDIVDGKPYKYGAGWLYREIPGDDLKRIREIIATGR